MAGPHNIGELFPCPIEYKEYFNLKMKMCEHVYKSSRRIHEHVFPKHVSLSRICIGKYEN